MIIQLLICNPVIICSAIKDVFLYCILILNHGITLKAMSYSPNFFKDVSFHVSFHVKFGNMGCFDFSINNPQHMFGYVTFKVKYYILSQIFYTKIW